MTHPHSRPWVQIDEIVTPTLAAIVGAQPDEVACMGSLTANLHLLLTSFYKPTDKRHKIMYEGKAFPSDSVGRPVLLHAVATATVLPLCTLAPD